MRKALYGIVPLIAVAGIVWLVWFKPGKGAEPEKQPETDVSIQVGKIMRATLRGYVIAYGVVEAEPAGERRSEEHTSELQSLTNLVCRLLLEKKKKKK